MQESINTLQDNSLSNSFADHSRLNRTPKSNGTTPDTTNSFSKRGGLCAPSPTVNTMEAMAFCQQMFSSSFDTSTAQPTDVSMVGPGGGGAPPVGGVPVQVYCDDSENLTSARKKQEPGFRVFSDDQENMGTARKNAGLQIYTDQENVRSVRKGTQFQIHTDDQENLSTARKGMGLQVCV